MSVSQKKYIHAILAYLLVPATINNVLGWKFIEIKLRYSD